MQWCSRMVGGQNHIRSVGCPTKQSLTAYYNSVGGGFQDVVYGCRKEKRRKYKYKYSCIDALSVRSYRLAI